MDKQQIFRKLAELETINDQLQAELRFLDTLLRKVGFEQGLISLRDAALDLIEEEGT